jgi:hypothetical protein
MGRGAGPAGAGDFVKNVLWFLALALVGCTHVSTRVDSGGTVTTSSSFSAGVSGKAGAAAWALIGIGLIAAEAANPTPPRAPPLDERRRVNEVDCTKPIADWSANLKC